MPFPGYSTKGCSPGHAVAVMGAAVADTLPAGNTALIAALGGNSNVFAFYDGRAEATATTWDDCRGAGFGPQLVAGGSGLAYDDENFLFTTGGAGYLVSAAQAALDHSLTDLSVVVVGVFVDGTSTRFMGAVSTGTSRGIGVGVVAGTPSTIRAVKVASGGTLNSSVAVSANRRVAAVAWSNDGISNYFIDVPDQARNTLSDATDQGSGGNAISVFARSTGTSLAPSGASCSALIVCKSLLDETAVDAIRDWAVTHHGAVAA